MSQQQRQQQQAPKPKPRQKPPASSLSASNSKPRRRDQQVNLNVFAQEFQPRQLVHNAPSSAAGASGGAGGVTKVSDLLTAMPNGQLVISRPRFGEPSQPQRQEPKQQQQQQEAPARLDEQSLPENQRERLIIQLSSGSYECAICCHTVRAEVAVWSCDSCYNIFHLFCIKKWSQSVTGAGVAAAEDPFSKRWRCPTCQKGFETKCGFRYTCFCSKTKDPEFSPGECPHTCGQLCGKRRGELCEHPCNLPCHPGPCPPCQAFVTRRCYCGRSERRAQCCESVRCGQACDRQLDCGRHRCAEPCHQGACTPCDKVFNVTCHCGKSEAAQRTCADYHRPGGGAFACARTCGRSLACGLHKCQLACHPGACTACPRSPELAGTCPCGRATLLSLTGSADGARKLCTDPLPTCKAACGRVLHCDPRHTCTADCHDGDCPPCQLTTSVTCRCGRLTKEVPCAEADARYRGAHAEILLCQRRCKKMRLCGVHRCGELCCIQQDHPCPQTCSKPLPCGLHQCEEPCHLGRCPACPRILLNPVSCLCGAQSIQPPVPCGARPPDCDSQCPRLRPCGHPSLHECHLDGEACPPCAYLVTKRCQCGRSLRQNVPCHQSVVSCGVQCGRGLPCGHRCAQLCHSGECSAVAEKQQQPACKQPCKLPREDCGHPCLLPCHHPEPCGHQPPCQEAVTLRCPCARRVQEVPCHLAAQMSNAGLHLTVALGGEMDLQSYRELQTRGSLQCDAQCQLEKRNRQLAEALGIDSDSAGSTTSGAAAGGVGAVSSVPLYAKPLLDLWKAYPSFAAMVESRLDEACSAVVNGRSQSRSVQFQAPNRDGRKFIYELAEVYGCEVQVTGAGSDASRTVTATAKRGRARLPDRKLSAETQRLFGIGGSQFQQQLQQQRLLPRAVQSWSSGLAASTGGSHLTTLGRVATAYSRLPDQMDSLGISRGGGGVSDGSNSSPRVDYFDFSES